MKITSMDQLKQLEREGKLLGVFEVPKKLYHTGPGVSCSGLKDILESPYYYKWIRDKPSRRIKKVTKHMRIGEATHALTLEPDDFPLSTIVAGKNGHTKAYQEAKQMIHDDDLDINLITEEEFEIVEQAKNLLASKELARKILSGYHEYAFYWIDEETKLLCKCRPDSLHRGGIMGDLKVSGAHNRDEFMSIAHDFKYHVQNAFYMDGVVEAVSQASQSLTNLIMPKRFFLVGVLNIEPMRVVYGEFPPEFVDEGRKLYRKALRSLRRSIDEDYWPQENEFFNEEKGKWEERVEILRPRSYMYVRDENK